MENELITTAQILAQEEINYYQLNYLVLSGKLEVVEKIAGRRLFAKSAIQIIEAWLLKQKQRGKHVSDRNSLDDDSDLRKVPDPERELRQETDKEPNSSCFKAGQGDTYSPSSRRCISVVREDCSQDTDQTEEAGDLRPPKGLHREGGS